MAGRELEEGVKVKLIDLNPHWILPSMQWCDGQENAYYVGVSFNCPVCGNRLSILFKPHMDPNGLKVKYGWPDLPSSTVEFIRTGETFDHLTLQPSINFMPHDWHGNISDGEMITSQHP